MAADLSLVRKCRSSLQAGLKGILFLMALTLSSGSMAAEDRYQFETIEQEKRFQTLSLELRCMVCDNQSLADSNAPLAQDLRLEVYRQIMAGKTDSEIKAYLVERYGVAVLYEPPIQANTLLLWVLPIILLLGGALIWVYRVQLNKKNVS